MIRTTAHETEELPLSNEMVADRLDELAEGLEAQHANEYRVRAYRTAAVTVRNLKQPVVEILDRRGIDGLTQLPGIGPSLARAIERLSRTGRLPLLEQVRGVTTPERVLTTVPGIGRRTAERIHDVLGIDTLAELEAAAYDGRLAGMPGMGTKRVRAVRESLAGRFHRRPSASAAPRATTASQPSVAELLDIDEEYRRKATADWLLRIAPRRFNPAGEAWLPILHTQRDGREYTALYSNTARAHELGTTHDWVVIYSDEGDGGGQWTVVTSLFGDLKGRRIVRGREAECEAHYRVQ
jgi:Holliday junction resolvasome RuvABC DNA-binding subunit